MQKSPSVGVSIVMKALGRVKSTPLMEGGTAAPLLWREVQSPPSVVIKGLRRVKSGMQHPSYGGRYKSPPSVVIKGLGRV